jgi:probable rRNA maturation factor
MNFRIDIQHGTDSQHPISDKLLMAWAKRTLAYFCANAELTLRLVSAAEMMQLNQTYRAQHKPTNVLAFPANIPVHIKLKRRLLGDVVICPAVLAEESVEQLKSLEAHWAHIVIHGILHLLGFDHMTQADEIIMQQHEIALLSSLGFDNPYLNRDVAAHE